MENKSAIRILDIDLDFFLSNRHMGRVTETNRLDSHSYKPWKIEKVEEFLENCCGLSKTNKTPGKLFVHHIEVFYFLRQLQEANNFSYKFKIDHVDAHADLGL